MLLDFWTYSSVNCVRCLPAVRNLWEAYRDDGLHVIGVHTPDFTFEQEREHVERAVEQHEIRYPVALDPTNATWERYGNMYWPRKALIGPEGNIRYESIGEGGHAELEQELRRLIRLAGGEPGEAVFEDPAEPESTGAVARPGRPGVSPDIYAGAGKGKELGNEQASAPYTTVDFTDGRPGEHRLHRIYLDGPWRREDEYLVSEGEGAATVRFAGAECNAVLGPAGAAFAVELDGEPVPEDERGPDLQEKDGETIVTADMPGLYRLVDRDRTRISELALRPRGDGSRLYAYTFG